MSTTTEVDAQIDEVSVPPDSVDGQSRAPVGGFARFSAFVPFVFGLLVPILWFDSGKFIATGDVSPFVRQGIEDEVGWLWNHLTTGAGAPISGIGQTFEVLLLGLVEPLGVPNTVAQWLLFGITVGAAAAGASYFATAFGIPRRFAFVASLIAVANPLVITLMPNLLPFVSIALMGGLGGLVLQARTRPRPVLFAVMSLGLSWVALNPPLLAIMGVWVASSIGLAWALNAKPGLVGCWNLLKFAVPLSFALNLWWLIPTLQTVTTTGVGTSFAAVTDTSSWLFTHQRASLLNSASLVASWGWPFPEYFPWNDTAESAPLSALRYVLPLAAFIAPFVALPDRRRAAAVLASGALVLVLLCKGMHEPLSGVNGWMYDRVPGFWLFREPVSKFGPVLVLVYGVLVAITVEGLVARTTAMTTMARRRLSAAAVASMIIAIAAFPFPIWTGEVVADERPLLPPSHVTLPQDWIETADAINADPTLGKALVLPYADYYQMPTNWGFYGADVVPRQMIERPVVMRLPGGYFGETEGFDNLLDRVDRSLSNGDTSSARQALSALGVSHVVLRNDYDRAQFPDREFGDPRVYRGALRSLAAPMISNSVAEVFEVTDADAMVLATSDRGPVGTDVEMVNPARYDVTLDPNGRTTVELRESYGEGWQLSGLPAGVGAVHEMSSGYANSWTFDVDQPVTISMTYRPADYGRWAKYLSLAVGVVVVAFVAGGSIRRRRTAGG